MVWELDVVCIPVCQAAGLIPRALLEIFFLPAGLQIQQEDLEMGAEVMCVPLYLLIEGEAKGLQ